MEYAKIARTKKTSIVDREIERIIDNDGTCTAQLLVDRAKAEDHPLHRYFEWDDSVAAQKYRLAQATSMILASKFVCVLNEPKQDGQLPEAVHVESSQPVRKYLPVGRGEGFRMRTDVLSDDDARKALVEKKRSVLVAWCKSVIDIDELAGLRSGIEKLLTAN